MEGSVTARKFTHWIFVPYSKGGHMSSIEAMTMGRVTCVVLLMALLTKLRSGNRVSEGI